MKNPEPGDFFVKKNRLPRSCLTVNDYNNRPKGGEEKIQVSFATKHVFPMNIVQIQWFWSSMTKMFRSSTTKSREILLNKQQGVFFHEISFREKIGPARFREISQGFREK